MPHSISKSPKIDDITRRSFDSAPSPSTPAKRARGPEHAESSLKRSKTFTLSKAPPTFLKDPNDPLAFSFHSISPTSSLQQSCTIAVSKRRLQFVDPNPARGTQSVASIPLTEKTYAFLLPHPEGMKPHWSVIVLTQDTKQQVVLAVPQSPLSITTKSAAKEEKIHPDGSESGPLLIEALSHVQHFTVQNPREYSPISFCVSARFAGVDGTLYLLPNGILWDQKPCQFFELSNIAQVRPRVLDFGKYGHFETFSICVSIQSGEDQEDRQTSGKKTEGEGTKCVEFESVDEDNMGRVTQWIKARKSLFAGAPEPPKTDYTALRLVEEEEESDSSDEDFMPDDLDASSEPGEEFNEDYDSDEQGVGDDSFFEDIVRDAEVRAKAKRGRGVESGEAEDEPEDED